MSLRKWLWVVACCGLWVSSCNIINPSEQIPSYLSVEKFTVHSVDSVKAGSSSSNITDVWVAVDGVSLGAYQLPAKFPLLYSGPHRVSLMPGIMLNGIARTRAAYTILNPVDTIMNLQAGKVITVNPVTDYDTIDHFKFLEDFDQHGSSFKIRTDSDTLLDTIRAPDPNVFEGHSGYVYLDDSRPTFHCEARDSFYLPGFGSPCYVEMNYKCNNEFHVGTIAYTSSGVFENDLLIINPTDIWKKIYVNLTPQVSSIVDASAWKIYIKAVKNNGQSAATLYFDNIKVVY